MKFLALLLVVLATIAIAGCTGMDIPLEETQPPEPEPDPEPALNETAQVNETIQANQTSQNNESQNTTIEIPSVVEITLTAKKWEFDPSTITVKKGQRVKIYPKTLDVTHGFKLAEYGINRAIDPLSPIIIDFVANKAGTFSFVCSVFCGSGHSTMAGTFIVEELLENEFLV